MPTAEKIQLVGELTTQFREAQSVFVADYAGLKVSDMTELRRKLREDGVKFRVVKNTLLRRAATDAGLSEVVDYFKGPTAVAFGPADPVNAAKIFQDFVARLERPKVRRFIVERRVYGAADLKAIATLPPRDVLLAQLVSAVEGPIAMFISTLDGIVRELIGTVDALAKKREAAA